MKDGSGRVKRQYFEWLVSIIGDEWSGFRYRYLLRRLFRTEFYWIVGNDDNRETDGLYLRAQWLDLVNRELVEAGQLPVDGGILDGPCSVLEMMIGLAWRMEEDVMMNEKYGNRTPYWFWFMCENLTEDFGGLESFSDEEIGSNRGDGGADVRLRYLLDRMLKRAYDEDGHGGCLFIFRRPNMDMRRVEIWSQAMAWLSENYLNEE